MLADPHTALLTALDPGHWMAVTLFNPFEDTIFPIGDWVEAFVDWLVNNYREFFQVWIKNPINWILENIEWVFQSIPQLPFLLLAPILIWQLAGSNVAILSFICLLVIGLIGAWAEAMTTLSLVVTAVVFCTLIGVPLGIFSAINDRFQSFIKPILDVMQTLPAFVYLVPVVMLFGIGAVPGVIVTFVFAVPPLIRLTNLGIRQVQEDVVEAALAFGSTPGQVLREAQIPLAMPTILAGLNQSIMLSLSMVVIASLIGVEGLGQMVNRGIGRVDISLASEGGLGIVLLAIMLDRITQALGQPGQQPFLKRGPLGYLLGKFKDQSPEPATSQG
jgi:ABC-type proline/glycine betaine transport system permease subunit